MKVKILIDDIGERFKKNEIGELLKNDSEKYDYCVKLPGKIQLPDFLGGGLSGRIFYFYKNEVEVLNDI